MAKKIRCLPALQPRFDTFLQQRHVFLGPLTHDLPQDLTTSRFWYLIDKRYTTGQPLVLGDVRLDPALNVLRSHPALQAFLEIRVLNCHVARNPAFLTPRVRSIWRHSSRLTLSIVVAFFAGYCHTA